MHLATRKKYLGEMLLESGAITPEQLNFALKLQKQSKDRRLGDVLKELGYITEQKLISVLENQLGIPFVSLSKEKIEPEMATHVPINIARSHTLVPVKVVNDVLHVAMEDPYSFLAIDDVRMVSRMQVQPLLAKPEDIIRAIDQLYGNEYAEKALEDISREYDFDELVADIDQSSEDVGNAPIVRLVNSIIEEAVKHGASDVHIEPLENDVRIRTRIDGRMAVTLNAPKHAQNSIIARVKIMGNMNIAEKRVPQDGRAELSVLGHDVDARISTLPTVHGEKAVLRLLDRSSFLRPKQELGFTEDSLKLFDELLLNPHGIILITGPTGSGKSTTLYTMLSELNKETDNIITIEDPVEYMMKGLNQVHVNVKAGLTFPSALRSILRQDPDIIMIGEMRDKETVEIAIRAAITGHLVLSTIHTNDSASTISRLTDMGVEPFMLSASLVGIIAQRLVRKICPFCKKEVKLNAVELRFVGMENSVGDQIFYHGEGCAACSNTGYKGRIAVHEIMLIDRRLREMIATEATVDTLRDYALKSGMHTLKTECTRLLKEGITTIDEVYKVAYSGD
ncbi:MAG: Flp pilus assembly complex ATPase component TadA [Clostridiales bacterium]|nr:Flp pilus assembly complex ATPase component TadA [Clostridiales bacterium]